ncbi:hypothetical protein EJB05_24442 [Eragrostis curvula]|uniref:Zinc finger GRF-type domain-containing protein n=1 Tax=Eragrostis curvula TaxID=38414 RepID=A0A5J9VAN6_9POAL|nr:hypothetical protein EJB05_24442 [Eragrostis curvula]
MEFPNDPPHNKETLPLGDGFIAPMCICGTPCKLVKSLVLGDDYGKRLWICKNYQYDPSQRLYSSDTRSRSPLPLCEFIEYVDTEQTPEDIAHVYRVAQRARRHWLDMEAEERREEERRKMRQEDEERRRKYEAERKQREEAERRRKQEEDRLAYEAREAERERMRERARRARAAGPDAFRKGKYPRCTQ